MSLRRKAGAFIALSMCVGFLGGCEAPNGNSAPPKTYLPPPSKNDVPEPPPRPSVEVPRELKVAALQELEAALASPQPLIRTHAIEAVKDATGAVGAKYILKVLEDADPLARFAASMAAGELRLVEARPALLRLLNDTDPHVQVGVIFALHRTGDVRYSSGLEQALRSPQSNVRANAAFALGRLGEASATKILRPLLKDPAVEVRLQSAEALWRLGDEQGLSYLVAAGLSGNPASQMVGLLGLAGPRDRRVIEHVRAGLSSDYLEVKLVTARALGMLGSDEMFVPAVQATRSAETRQRYLAALALGAIGRPDAQAELATLLKDGDPDVRVAAASALLQLR